MGLLSNLISRVKGSESLPKAHSNTESASQRGESPDLSQASCGAESSNRSSNREGPQALLDKMSRSLANDLVLLNEIGAMYEEEIRIRKEIDQCEKRSLEMLKNGDVEGAVALAKATSEKYGLGSK